jgi:predicted nucleic acid-binding protein
MLRRYVDASALGKLLIEEAESSAVADLLQDHLDSGGALQSAIFVEAEVRRIGMRRGIPQAAISELLEVIDLFEVDRSMCRTAGLLPPPALRSIDALHVAAALAGGADRFITYDRRQADAALAAGIPVESPGATPAGGG